MSARIGSEGFQQPVPPDLGHLVRFLVAGLLVVFGHHARGGAVYETDKLWSATKEEPADDT